jgi:integrase
VPKTYTTAELAALTRDGEFRVAPNLFLQVRGDTRSWIFRYRHLGRLHRIGFGRFPDVTLTDAKRKATAARKQLDDGVDPLRARREERRAQLQAAGSPRFDVVTAEFIASREGSWRDPKRAPQWAASLKTHAHSIWSLPVTDVRVDDVHDLLRPLWTRKPETADRVRSRIKSVIDFAVAKGLRDEGPNPADITGPLGKLLPPLSSVQTVVHHASVPYPEAPALFARIGAVDTTAARALAFVLLTAVRSGEARLARWSEIDLEAKLWTIPAARTKTGQEHLVPLSDAAVALLTAPGKPDSLIFPGAKRGRPLSDLTLLKFIRTLRKDASVHGLRSTFRVWTAEQTDTPREIAEAALGHRVGDETERAYARTTFFTKRVELMAAWAGFLLGGQK